MISKPSFILTFPNKCHIYDLSFFIITELFFIQFVIQYGVLVAMKKQNMITRLNKWLPTVKTREAECQFNNSQ